MKLLEIPPPQRAIASLAAFIRDRLGEVGLWSRGEATQVAVVVVAATTPFAASSYARARLLRQMHASGMLSESESEIAG